MKSLISKSEVPLQLGEPRGLELSDLARRARLLLEIAQGERRLLPEFGCRIHELELASAPSREVAAAFVEEALERWLPGLGVDRAEVGVPDGGRVELRLRQGETWHRLWISHRIARGEEAQ